MHLSIVSSMPPTSSQTANTLEFPGSVDDYYQYIDYGDSKVFHILLCSAHKLIMYLSGYGCDYQYFVEYADSVFSGASSSQ